MKQLFVFVLIGFLIGAGGVWGSFIRERSDDFSLTLDQAKRLPEGILVVLTGYIINKIGPDLYLFADQSDMAMLRIDPWRWNGLWVQPKDQVKIIGGMRLFKGFWQIDVTQIRLLD